MIYLSIPEGMVYQQKKVISAGSENASLKDFFVDPNGKRPDIPLQDIVKDMLRTNTGQKKIIEKDGITLYRKIPPYEKTQFLQYAPEENAKFATKTTPVVASGMDFRASLNKANTKQYGQLWFKENPLPKDKQELVEDKRDEQRDNRRHIGDSPKAT